MFNVCYRCGEYRADKTITPGPDGTSKRCARFAANRFYAYALCPVCGHPHPFWQWPLLVVGGASGAGKSCLLQALTRQPPPEVVLLDADILWSPAFNQPEDQYHDYFNTWLRLCKNIGQAGRPAVLFGAGAGVPSNLEPLVERRYFSRLHTLALVCEDDLLAERLRQRPAWRGSQTEAFIASQVDFNQWLQRQAQQAGSGIDLLDTSRVPVEQTADQALAWIRQHCT